MPEADTVVFSLSSPFGKKRKPVIQIDITITIDIPWGIRIGSSRTSKTRVAIRGCVNNDEYSRFVLNLNFNDSKADVKGTLYL